MRHSNSKYWDFGCPIAGIFLTLAFAPFEYSYLALAALSYLFASCLNISPLRAALRGYLFGLGTFGVGVSWVFISIHDYGGASVTASTALTIVFIGIWALFPAMAGYVSAIIAPQSVGMLRTLTLPFVWILIEFSRGFLWLNGFPWLQVAYSQLDTPLAGYIPILGVYGTGYLLALTAAGIVCGIYYKKQRALIACLIITCWGSGSALRTVKWTYAIGQPFTAALLQGNITQDQKWRPENKVKTLLQYKRMTEENWGAAVIIWPETAIPAYLSEVDESFLQPLQAEATKHQSDLIISVPAQGNSEHENYNAVITLGKEQGMYRKNHLLPFGEYLPLQPLSGLILDYLQIKLGNFKPGGENQALLKAGGYFFITSICYEDAFGYAHIRDLANAAYLVNVTNDAWFGDSIEPHQHFQIARMRAMETGRYLLRATNTGLTGIVAPDGEIVGQAPLFKTTVLTGALTPMAGVTPYARLGDGVIIYALFICLAGIQSYRQFFHKKLRTNYPHE
jgi:apolipoprotein N-acyltransferase